MANYFNYIDEAQHPGKFKSYIVLGEAMPEGATVYVLRKLRNGRKIEPEREKGERDGSLELWAPLTGECYWYAEHKHDAGFFGGTHYSLE